MRRLLAFTVYKLDSEPPLCNVVAFVPTPVANLLLKLRSPQQRTIPRHSSTLQQQSTRVDTPASTSTAALPVR